MDLINVSELKPKGLDSKSLRQLLRVSPESVIRFETNCYSVPEHLIGQIVAVRVASRELRIYHEDQLVARHQRSICGGGLPFHAALVELKARGFLLAGPGGRGKSTCCRRLPDYWKPLCDDETLVVLDRRNRYRAHPFPTWGDYIWKSAESKWNIQYCVPLSAIFFLERSENDGVMRIGGGEAAVLMSESPIQVCQRFWRRADRTKQRQFRSELFNNACAMAKVIPAFRLRVSLHGRFWEEIEKALGW